MKIIQSTLTENDCYKANRYITPKGLMIHSIGVPQPSAEVIIKTWNMPASAMGGRQVCVHGFIEPDGTVFQTLPWKPCMRGWHGGGESNNTHMGFEMTEPSTIRYSGGATWGDLNPEKTKAHVMGTYSTAVELFAHLCALHSLDPLADGVIISHSEGFKLGIASNHGDVEHIWDKMGLSMTRFRIDIKNKMEDDDMATVISRIAQTAGLSEEAAIKALGTLAKFANTTEEAWERVGAQVLIDMGVMGTPRAGNEPVEFGELGAILKNFRDKYIK